MFDIVIDFITDFIGLFPVLIPFTLIMNLSCSILWGKE